MRECFIYFLKEKENKPPVLCNRCQPNFSIFPPKKKPHKNKNKRVCNSYNPHAAEKSNKAVTRKSGLDFSHNALGNLSEWKKKKKKKWSGDWLLRLFSFFHSLNSQTKKEPSKDKDKRALVESYVEVGFRRRKKKKKNEKLKKKKIIPPLIFFNPVLFQTQFRRLMMQGIFPDFTSAEPVIDAMPITCVVYFLYKKKRNVYVII